MKKKDFKIIIWLLGLVFLNSCATFGTGTVSKKQTPSNFSNERFRDVAVVNYVNQVGRHLTDVKIDIVVLKTSRIQGNSFFDGPQINITRGMLNVLINEAELACLIGHEIGHKVLHRDNRYNKKGNSWRDIFLPDDIAKAKWSQKREEEADEYGAELCHKAGYNPYAFLDFMERMSQFQRNDFLSSLDELAATHKDFKNRAKHLKKYLEKLNFNPNEGFLKRTEYVHSLTALRAIQSGDAVNELLPGGARKVLLILNEIEQELKDHLRSKQQLSPSRFIHILEKISGIVNQYAISLSVIQASYLPFMKEILSQDSPLWDGDELKKKIEEILNLAGRVGVGLIPVVGDSVDLYEFLTGKEFGTNHLLSVNERIITAAGLLAGGGKMWREGVANISLTLKDTQLSNKLGKRTIADGQYALKNGVEVLDAAKKGTITVIGKHPRYLQTAEKFGANRFKIPSKIWNNMTEGERWFANKKFLDRAISRGDDIILSDPVKNVSATTGYFRRELDYLADQGFKFNKEGTRMIRK